MISLRMLTGEEFKNQVLTRIGQNPYKWATEHGLKRGLIDSINKNKIPDPKNLVLLAGVLNVSTDWLLTGNAYGIASESSFPYGISSEEYKFLTLYRGSDEVGREDARYLLERHQERAKKKAGH